jgi:hypothetical protein
MSSTQLGGRLPDTEPSPSLRVLFMINDDPFDHGFTGKCTPRAAPWRMACSSASAMVPVLCTAVRVPYAEVTAARQSTWQPHAGVQQAHPTPLPRRTRAIVQPATQAR